MHQKRERRKKKEKSNSERSMENESQHPFRKCNSGLSHARILVLTPAGKPATGTSGGL
jgi:hypothetical protein